MVNLSRKLVPNFNVYYFKKVIDNFRMTYNNDTILIKENIILNFCYIKNH